MGKKLYLYFSAFAVSAAIFAFDWWSKSCVLRQLELVSGNAIEVTPFFNLVLVYNRGVSFGMFAGHNQPFLLICVSAIIVLILLAWLLRNESIAVALAIGSITGGAVGNIFDRLHYGAVVDFLDFHVMGWHWPAFNVADSFVFIGVVVLCIYSMFFEDKNSVRK